MEVKKILKLLIIQLEGNFGELSENEKSQLKKIIPTALSKCMNCLNSIENKYYKNFDCYHSGHYTTFLYYLSNIASLNEYIDLKNKVYYLNKIMHSLDVYADVKLPNIFYFEHPVGTVLGRAKYSDYFTIYQNCTVGGNKEEKRIYYPKFKENVTMYSYSCVLGNCIIGSNVIIASHTYIINENIPDNSIVFGQSPNLIIKPNTKKNYIFKENK